MDLGEAIHYRQDELPDFGFKEGCLTVEPRRQRLSFDVLHDDVAGAVLFQVLIDIYDVRMAHVVPEDLGFVPEPLKSPFEVCLFACSRDDIPIAGARCPVAWIVFLDRNAPAQIQFPRQVGDAEPAPTELPFYAVVADYVSRRQRVVTHRVHHLVLPARASCQRPDWSDNHSYT